MGIVFRGYDPELNRDIAIKIMNPAMKVGAEDVIRFQREARLAGQLQHPGIVPIHELGCLPDGRMYIAMRLIEGTTLRELMDERASSSQKSHLLEVFHQISQTVAYAHSKDIIHRDLKPDNVMVGTFGEVQVMDWGLAKQIRSTSQSSIEQRNVNPSAEFLQAKPGDMLSSTSHSSLENSISATRTGTVFGTPAYMSPEQAQGEFTDKRADVFALGAILTEILTGSAPYHEGSATVRLNQAATSDLKSSFERLENSSHDDALIELAKDCLSPVIANRPVDAGVVHQRFGDYLHLRDEKLNNRALANARHEAQLASERKRRKQVTTLTCLILAIFALSTVAGTMYIHERNTKQQQLAQRNLKRKSEIQNEIRSANLLYTKAFDFDHDEQTRTWNNALVQINRAGVLLESTKDRELQVEFVAAKHRIEERLANAARTFQEQQNDEKMKLAIRSAIRRAQYPNLKLQFKRDPAVVDDIRRAFQEYGVSVDSEIEDAAGLIRSSKIMPELISGLRLWRIYLVGRNKKLRDPELLNWIDNLTQKVDPDPFRNQIRQFGKKGESQRLLESLADPRALNCLLSVRVVLDSLDSLGLKNEERDFLSQARLLFPNDFEIHWRLATHYRTGPGKDLRSALECFQICLSLQPDNPSVLIDVCSVLTDLKEHQRAMDYANVMLRRAPEYPEPYVTIAINLALLNRPIEALEYCYKAIEQRPVFPLAQYNRSLIAGMVGRTDEELEAIHLAIEGRRSIKHFKHRASIYQRMGQFNEAIESLHPAMLKFPNHARIRMRLGDLHAKIGNPEVALDYYREAAGLAPLDHEIQTRFVDCLLDLGRAEEAEVMCQVNLICFQSQSDWRPKLMQALGEQGYIEDSLELLHEILNDPSSDVSERQLQYVFERLRLSH